MIVLKLAAVVLLLLVLVNKKVQLGLALLIASLVMLFINGKGLGDFGQVLITMVNDPLTYTMTLTILFISIMGYLMNRYKMLDRMIEHLEQILKSAKATILLAPTIIGLLQVAGGALMSCPVVDKLGDKLNISNAKRAAINMIFRHGLFFSYPLSPTIILASQLGGFELFDFIKIQFPITIVMFVLGYVSLLRGVKDKKPEKISSSEYFGHIKGFLIYSSPIWVSIVMTVSTGLPIHFSLPIGILVAIIVNYFDAKKDAQYKLEENPAVLVVKGINVKMTLSVLGILLFKTVVGGLSELNEFIVSMVNGGVPVEIIVIVAVGILSFSMGNFQPSLAVVYPLILPVATTYNLILLFAYLMYAVGFFAYFTSPIHMCQVLTLEYFKTNMKDLYKCYLMYLPALIVSLVSWYFALKFVILA